MPPSPSDHPLPGRLTSFIGRLVDLDKMLDLFQDPSIRLVTILGAGGIGKTRLALEVASLLESRFLHGAFFVPLASLTSAAELLPALAKALGVQLPPGCSLQQAILNHLAGRDSLLVFDSFEHLLDGSSHINEFLIAAPQVKILVTSREKLRLEAETIYHLAGMELPTDGPVRKVDEFDAVRLFLQKARQVRPGFSLDAENIPAVIQICRLVDGNALGILLAAAWIEHFSPKEILDQISSNLDFLSRSGRDAEPRHANMRAVFDSSFSRLGEDEKAVFRKLAVFRGGFDLAAAQSVAAADLRTLIALVDKSLLNRDPGSSRYDLHELLRQYAGEELDAANEREDTILAHTHYYMDFVLQRETRLISQAQTVALDEMQADFDNIRQACAMVIENRDFSSARLILPVLYAFCDMRSRFYEGAAFFYQAVKELAPQAGENPQTAWALALLSWYDLRIYHAPFQADDKISPQVQICLERGSSSQDSQGTAASLVLLGAIAEDQGDFETAIRKYEEAMQLHPSLDDIYWVNMRIGLCRQAAHQYQEAIQAFSISLQRGRDTGERVKTGWALLNIGDTLLLQRKAAEAEGYLKQACGLFQEIETRFGLIRSHYSLSRVALELGDLRQGQVHAEIASDFARQIHSVSWISKTGNLLQQFASDFPQPFRETKDHEPITFSQRELEVLQLLKSEMNGPEIARRLFISLNTVRYHTKNIYQKLGVNTRLEAIQRANEFGY